MSLDGFLSTHEALGSSPRKHSMWAAAISLRSTMSINVLSCLPVVHACFLGVKLPAYFCQHDHLWHYYMHPLLYYCFITPSLALLLLYSFTCFAATHPAGAIPAPMHFCFNPLPLCATLAPNPYLFSSLHCHSRHLTRRSIIAPGNLSCIYETFIWVKCTQRAGNTYSR